MSSFNYLYAPESEKLFTLLKDIEKGIKSIWTSLLRLENYSKAELCHLHEFNNLIFECKSMFYQIHLCKSNKSFIRMNQRLKDLESKYNSLMLEQVMYYHLKK